MERARGQMFEKNADVPKDPHQKRIELLTTPGHVCDNCVCTLPIIATFTDEQKEELVAAYQEQQPTRTASEHTVIHKGHVHGFANRMPGGKADPELFAALLEVVRSEAGAPPHTLAREIMNTLLGETGNDHPLTPQT